MPRFRAFQKSLCEWPRELTKRRKTWKRRSQRSDCGRGKHVAGGSMNRRTFLTKSAAAFAGGIASKALSYDRIVGANDRISLGHIGIGNRGTELDWIVGQVRTTHNVEMTAVCDL